MAPHGTASSTTSQFAVVRWDRLGRVALLAVLVGVLFLYVGPARSYVSTWKDSSAKSAEVAKLRSEQRRLLSRRAALTRPATLEREARELGMVRPGERAYVIEDLPAERR